MARRYGDRASAEEGWARLVESEIPATVLDDPGPLGAPAGVDVLVSRRHLEAAQAILAGPSS